MRKFDPRPISQHRAMRGRPCHDLNRCEPRLRSPLSCPVRIYRSRTKLNPTYYWMFEPVFAVTQRACSVFSETFRLHLDVCRMLRLSAGPIATKPRIFVRWLRTSLLTTGIPSTSRSVFMALLFSLTRQRPPRQRASFMWGFRHLRTGHSGAVL
jgi:hypothetical protein